MRSICAEVARVAFRLVFFVFEFGNFVFIWIAIWPMPRHQTMRKQCNAEDAATKESVSLSPSILLQHKTHTDANKLPRFAQSTLLSDQKDLLSPHHNVSGIFFLAVRSQFTHSRHPAPFEFDLVRLFCCVLLFVARLHASDINVQFVGNKLLLVRWIVPLPIPTLHRPMTNLVHDLDGWHCTNIRGDIYGHIGC